MVKKYHKLKAMKEKHYLENRAKRSRIERESGKITKCTRCYDEPVKTTPYPLSDTYIDDDGKLVHTQANYCHRCLSIAYRAKDKASDRQKKNEKALEKLWSDSEPLTKGEEEKRQSIEESEQERYREHLERQGLNDAIIEARIKERAENERKKNEESARADIRKRRVEIIEKALWDSKNKMQILSPLLPKQIKKFQSRQNKDKKIGQTRVQEI